MVMLLFIKLNQNYQLLSMFDVKEGVEWRTEWEMFPDPGPEMFLAGKLTAAQYNTILQEKTFYLIWTFCDEHYSNH